jgi:hypothetical protein
MDSAERRHPRRLRMLFTSRRERRCRISKFFSKLRKMLLQSIPGTYGSVGFDRGVRVDVAVRIDVTEGVGVTVRVGVGVRV